MANFSKWLTNLSCWWILLGFVAVMTGLFFLFGVWQKTKRIRVQLLCLCGMDIVTLLFYSLSLKLSVSIVDDSGIALGATSGIWALIMALESILAFYVIIKYENKEDEKLNQWSFALFVGTTSVFTVILFQFIGLYINSISKWLTNLSYWWILLGFAAIMTGLFFLFGIRERTKRVRVQLLCLCGMDLVTLLFYLLTFNLRVSKVAAESGATPKTMPRLWAFLMLLASIGAFIAIIKSENKPDEKFNRWVFALLVGVGSIFSVILFQYIGYYISSAIFIFVVMIAMGEKNKLQLILVPVIWCLFTYYVFFRMLYIKLPFGLLFSWLPNHSLKTDLIIIISLLAFADILLWIKVLFLFKGKNENCNNPSEIKDVGGIDG